MSQSEIKTNSWFAWPGDSWLMAWYNQNHTPETLQDDGPAFVAASWMEQVQPLDLWGSLGEGTTGDQSTPPETTAFDRWKYW